MKVRVDIPIFAGLTKAWGKVEGQIEVAAVPGDGEWLELPFSDRFLSLGIRSTMKVWAAVTHADGSITILLDGAVAESRENAARIAEILESEYDFDIDEYDL